jgi:hypothetical protein
MSVQTESERIEYSPSKPLGPAGFKHKLSWDGRTVEQTQIEEEATLVAMEQTELHWQR